MQREKLHKPGRQSERRRSDTANHQRSQLVKAQGKGSFPRTEGNIEGTEMRKCHQLRDEIKPRVRYIFFCFIISLFSIKLQF